MKIAILVILISSVYGDLPYLPRYRHIEQYNNVPMPASGAYSNSVMGNEWDWSPGNSPTARPVSDSRSGMLQAIPPMELQQQVVDSTMIGPYGPAASETQIISRKRPSYYRPFLPMSPGTNSGVNTPPAAQQLSFCPFDPLYRHMLAMLNAYRKKILRPYLGPQASTALCMNEKLMRAAKLQSDFQALAKAPTHAGPRASHLGSLEDRLRWARFSVTSANQPAFGRSEAEELIYYWPSGPRDQVTMIKRLRGAMRDWQRDGWAVRIMADPKYKFFGFGLTRTRDGMYLTVILAKSQSEVCNLCPEDGGMKQDMDGYQPREKESYPPRPFDEDNDKYW